MNVKLILSLSIAVLVFIVPREGVLGSDYRNNLSSFMEHSLSVIIVPFLIMTALLASRACQYTPIGLSAPTNGSSTKPTGCNLVVLVEVLFGDIVKVDMNGNRRGSFKALRGSEELAV